MRVDALVHHDLEAGHLLLDDALYLITLLVDLAHLRPVHILVLFRDHIFVHQETASTLASVACVRVMKEAPLRLAYLIGAVHKLHIQIILVLLLQLINIQVMLHPL